jgi:hypothetical protein
MKSTPTKAQGNPTPTYPATLHGLPGWTGGTSSRRRCPKWPAPTPRNTALPRPAHVHKTSTFERRWPKPAWQVVVEGAWVEGQRACQQHVAWPAEQHGTHNSQGHEECGTNGTRPEQPLCTHRFECGGLGNGASKSRVCHPSPHQYPPIAPPQTPSAAQRKQGGQRRRSCGHWRPPHPIMTAQADT